MNRRDAALVVLVLIAALAGFALMLTQTGQGAQVEIAVNGEVYGIYDLDTDQTTEIGVKNICRIVNGAAWMEWADCPDQLCVHHSKISRNNETVVCLPNRVTLTILGGEDEGQPDTIVSDASLENSFLPGYGETTSFLSAANK